MCKSSEEEWATFLSRITEYRAEAGKNAAIKGSVASAMCKSSEEEWATFLSRITEYRAEAGKNATIVDGVASAMCKSSEEEWATFLSRIPQYRAEAGKNATIKDSVASAMRKSSEKEWATFLVDGLPAVKDAGITSMTNSLAARISDPKFVNEMRKCTEYLKKQATIFNHTGFVCRFWPPASKGHLHMTDAYVQYRSRAYAVWQEKGTGFMKYMGSVKYKLE